jgi:hypothetical protein
MSDPVVTPDRLAMVLGLADPDGPMTDRLSYLLELAQELCETIVSPCPVEARPVVMSVAIRLFANPVNVVSQAAGPFPVSYGPAAGGVYLTKQDRAALLRIAGRGGAFSIDPTPADAGQGLPPWDLNVTWLNGVPLIEDQGSWS